MNKKKRRQFNWHALRTKAIMSFLMIGLWAFAFHTFIYKQSEELKTQYHTDTNLLAKGEKAAVSLQNQLHESNKLLLNYLLTGNQMAFNQWEQTWEKNFPQAMKDFKAAAQQVAMADNEKQKLRKTLISYELLKEKQSVFFKQIDQKLIAKDFYTFYTADNAFDEEYMREVYASNADLVLQRDLILEHIQADLADETQAISLQLAAIESFIADKTETRKATFLSTVGSIQWALLIASLVGSLIGFALAYHLVKSLIMSIYDIKQAVKKLSTGTLPNKIEGSKNEMNYIIRELNNLINNLHQVKNFAMKVGKGEFDNNISVFNKQGELGQSLEEMKLSLYKVAQEDKQRNWVNEGFTKFADILRNNNSDIKLLSDNIISKLVHYLNANQGAIFLARENAEGEQVLKMTACYAYRRKKYLDKEVLPGEGLIGQAWQEQDTLYLTDVPEEYINIRSGLGDASPRCVLIIPLKSNEEVVGILEMASFKEFQPHEVEFLQKVSENIASTVSATLINEKTIRLLEESQQMTEAMQAQEEEMRQNMEELQTTQENMVRAKQETEKKEQNLNALINNTNDTIFAINTDYEITVVNDTLKNKYAKLGINLQVGTKMSDLLSGEQWDYWKGRYDKAMYGEAYAQIEDKSQGNKESYVQTFHNPIRSQEGEVLGVSVISRDVTDLIKAQKEIVRKEATLNALINNTDDTFFAVNTNYEIIVVNKTLQDRYTSAGISLDEGQNILELLPEAEKNLWKERYDRVLAGESFMIEQERKVGEKVLYIEGYYHPIEDVDGKIRGAAVTSKDITRWKIAMDEREEREKEIQKLRKALGQEDDLLKQVKKQAPSEPKTKKTKP